jgi:16S rRNA (cytosine967-C5)-methyltransferase
VDVVAPTHAFQWISACQRPLAVSRLPSRLIASERIATVRVFREEIENTHCQGMNVAANQQRTFLRLIMQLRPHWRRDASLPARIQSLLASHRGFGSRDRRLYRELIYTTLRYLPWIEPLLDPQPEEAVRRVACLAADLPATKTFRAIFANGEPPHGDKTELLPAWFRPHCPEIFSGAELEAQLRRAPLWLRLQTSQQGELQVIEEFESSGWSWKRSPILSSALELLTEADVTKTDAWRRGRIEIQDLGSQLILESVGAEPGGWWLDACAGAGGKSLQLARLLGPAAEIHAHDVRPEALDELRTRAARVGIACAGIDEPSGAATLARGANSSVGTGDHAFARIGITLQAPQDTYDGVLVDAPCSGSGTWRRAPHLKWVTTPRQIEQAAEKQRGLLHRFSRNVQPGGRLVYATCSLSRIENEEVVAHFLTAHPEFVAVPFANTFGASAREGGLTFLPALHDTDGFFVASLRRR